MLRGCPKPQSLVQKTNIAHNGYSCKDNGNSDEDSNDDSSGRSGGGGGSGDGGGDGCSSALSNLPLVNDATIVLMTFPTRPTMMTPLQWPAWDERQWHVRKGRGWAKTERRLSSSVAAAMD
jgi:hypothetical protein